MKSSIKTAIEVAEKLNQQTNGNETGKEGIQHVKS
jgi:hypothetical protein